ncbi:MAG: hypothetical protein ACLGIR_13365 [Actinomycetes bacterium]
MRHTRLLAPVLGVALLAAPTAALAQEAEQPVVVESPAEEGEEAPAGEELVQEEPVEEVEDGDEVAASDVLAGWLDALRQIAEALGAEGEDGAPTLTDEERLALEELAATLRDGLSAKATIAALEEEGEEEGADAEAEGPKGEIVSTVAKCAPRGKERGLVDGARNHGWWVSTAAKGGVVTLAVPQLDTSGDSPVVAGTTDVEFDLSTLEGAESLCAAIASIREADALLAEAVDEPTEKEQRRAEREERKADRDADREQRKADRDAAKQQRAEERGAAKAGRGDAKAGRGDAKAERGGSKADRSTEDGSGDED